MWFFRLMIFLRKTQLLILLMLVGLLFAWTAHAQVRDVRKFNRDMALKWTGRGLVVSLAFPEVFTERMRRRLSSGFASRLLVKVVLHDRKGKKVALGLAQFTILYDIWEERYRVRVRGALGKRDLLIRSMGDLVKACGRFDDLLLTQDRKLNASQRYRLSVVIEVNPASKEQRRKVRKYLANPDGRSSVGSPRSFFGSFSRIFVREKDIQADAIYTYRSPYSTLPKAAD
ncbi:MAG: hypothetical protein JRF33_15745 [Deltaproteobacteria bacterium]|nr:hypothetical protein [Deltaproteobacteria bacterium]